MFKDELVVVKIRGGKNWKVCNGFTYVTNKGEIIVVPDGFITDFASVPRGLWNLFPPTGEYGHAAVIHDFLYRNTSKPREECDKIFLEAMEELGVNWLTRHIVYRAVRTFGDFARTPQPSPEVRKEAAKTEPIN